jgi:hypothetical protein
MTYYSFDDLDMTYLSTRILLWIFSIPEIGEVAND